jgi:SAM-dependent methyltransferase
MAYAELTISDRNPVKRWLQRRRFSDVRSVLRHARRDARPRILDFGAGDGELVRQLAADVPLEATVFEPTPALMAEARVKLAGLDRVAFADSLESVASETFDYVFCLEVFEHLPPNETVHAIAEIHRLLKPDGRAVIGVPHELFLPALFKGVFRMWRRYGNFDASLRNVAASALGRPPAARPAAEIAPGVPYHFHHLGFDYRALQRLLEDHFRIGKRWFSPFPVLGAALNSEVYFLLTKAEPRP